MQASRQYSPTLLLAGLAVLVAAAALVLWVVSAPEVGTPGTTPAGKSTGQESSAASGPVTDGAAATTTSASPVMTGGSATALEADHVVGRILADNPTVEGGRAKLLESFSQFNAYEKIASTPHLINLVEDDGIVGLVNVLHDPATPTEAKELIFDNMLNRPPQVGWPVLLGVLAAPGHPLAQKARETLSIILGSEYGDRMDEWSKALEAQLTRQKQ